MKYTSYTTVDISSGWQRRQTFLNSDDLLFGFVAGIEAALSPRHRQQHSYREERQQRRQLRPGQLSCHWLAANNHHSAHRSDWLKTHSSPAGHLKVLAKAIDKPVLYP